MNSRVDTDAIMREYYLEKRQVSKSDFQRCENCNHWDKIWTDSDGIKCGSCAQLTIGLESDDVCGYGLRVYDDSIPITSEANFSCCHWKPKE